MIIAVAQYKSTKADISSNIHRHLHFIEVAADAGANLLIFPELSITGYEPTLAERLAVDIADARFDTLREICERRQITVGIGAPVQQGNGICIGLIIFQPGETLALYSKKWLHTDELPFFSSGLRQDHLEIDGNSIALGICYEISVVQHRESALRNGAAVYIASVAKTVKGMKAAFETLSDMARSKAVTIMISNAVGFCDNFMAAGRSALWSKDGKLIRELGGENEAILLFDTKSGEAMVKEIG